MDAQALKELRERLVTATGPDRDVDRFIHRDVRGLCLHINQTLEGAQSDTGFTCDDCGADSWGNRGKDGQRLNDRVPAYTASLDAAVTLVPDGMWWMFAKGKARPTEPLYGVMFFKEGTAEEVGPGAEHDSSLTLALCLARVEYEIAKAGTP